MRVILALLLTTVSCFAQTYTHRGFLDTRSTFYPREGLNDSAKAVGESVFRYEAIFRPARVFQIEGAIDFRADTHRQAEREFELSWRNREIQKPLSNVRRLSATLHKGPMTFEVGKQFIRWGKTDIVTPMDRFAPRDYLTVVDNDFLAIDAARLNFEKGSNTIEAVWSPQLTPSRIPLANQRWAPPPPEAPQIFGIPIKIGAARRFIPGGPQSGMRWNHAGRVEFEFSFYEGFDHLPSFEPGPLTIPPTGPQVDVHIFYPKIRAGGTNLAIQTRPFTIKAEGVYVSSEDSRADEYALFVMQLERQIGEWFFVGGYANEARTQRGTRTATFNPDRGLTKTFLGRAGYTIDANKSMAFEAAVRQDGDGVWVKGEYSQAFGQHWRLTFSLTGIGGASDDFLGQYEPNSHGIVVLRYSF